MLVVYDFCRAERYIFLLFFFQAEDGIRGLYVTGVQTCALPISFARIHQYLSMATPLLWTRQQDNVGVLGLALNACDDRSNGHRAELEQIRELLTTARELWRAMPEEGDERDRMAQARATFRLIHLADI